MTLCHKRIFRRLRRKIASGTYMQSGAVDRNRVDICPQAVKQN